MTCPSCALREKIGDGYCQPCQNARWRVNKVKNRVDRPLGIVRSDYEYRVLAIEISRERYFNEHKLQPTIEKRLEKRRLNLKG